MKRRCAGGRFLLARGILFFAMAMACAGRLDAQAPALEVLRSFIGPPDGLNPEAPAIWGSDGNFYGTTSGGGSYNSGTVFKVTPAGVLSTLCSFPSGAGGLQGALTEGKDGNFYGATLYGGSHGDGTIFKITPAGVLTNLYTFTGGADGSNPNGLTLGNDGNFYGTAFFGGDDGYGTVFKITPAGVLKTLYAFTDNNDGSYPFACLTLGNDGNFYGTTYSGGGDYAGTFFKITPAGVLTTLYAFGFGDGATNPQATLTKGSDGNFYGVTEYGGSVGEGSIFRITPAGAFTVIHNFTDDVDGSSPAAGLTLGNDGNFYGSTIYGGNDEFGTIFRITPAGALHVVYSFSNVTDGAHPQSALALGKDGNFYGTTPSPYTGSTVSGTVFKMTPAGVLTTLHTFTGSVGDQVAGLTQGQDGYLYGTTPGGDGSDGDGTAFKISPAGVLTTLYTFTGGASGGVPLAGLTQGNDGDFYGAASQGGSNGNGAVYGNGAVFKITSGGVVTDLYNFTGGSDGSEPETGLTLGSDGNFYGTTSGDTGTNFNGTIFKITPAGALTTLVSFPYGAGGAVPQASLVEGSNGRFYGVTGPGVGSSPSAIFQVTSAGDFHYLHFFSGGADGAYPNGLARYNDGNLYGTTYEGGSDGYGTVFKISPGGVLTTLHTFAGGADGSAPAAGLTLAYDGNFYGTTESGGDSNGDGTVFKITPAGVLTHVHTFTGGAGGSEPEATLTQGGDGNIYGTTNSGGQYGLGVIFRLILEKPTVKSAKASAQAGSAYSFQIAATNDPTSFGASNLPAGLGVNAATGLISGTPTKTGTFTVGLTATNSIGAGSGTLALTVSPAPVQPPAVSSETETAQAGSAFSFQILATNGPTRFGASNLPAGLSINTATGLISGAPTQSGRFPVGLNAANSGGTGAGTLALTVNP